MARKKSSAQSTVRNIRRNTRKKYNTEDKIRIVVEGLRGETTVAELCRREGISQSLYYKWSKEFLEAGKSRLAALNGCERGPVLNIIEEGGRLPGIPWLKTVGVDYMSAEPPPSDRAAPRSR